MKCTDAKYKLENYRMLRKIYSDLLNRKSFDIFSEKELETLFFKTSWQIETLEALTNNYELEDSYDQNTGELNKFYKE